MGVTEIVFITIVTVSQRRYQMYSIYETKKKK